MKKLLSILLAVSLLFALAIPAFAEGEQEKKDPTAALTELLSKDELTEEDLSTALSLLGDLIVKDVTGAVAFLDQFVRDPLPDTVVWNLDVRASMRKAESFYWLSAPKTVTKGIITARADREAIAIEITTDGNVSGDFSILLSARMFDFDRPVTITIDGERYEVTPEIREDVMEETLRERGDPSYIFEDRVSVSELKGN